jgi:hypothetical protein
LTFALLSAPGIASASSWVDTLASGSSGQDPGLSLPSAPVSVVAACTSPTGKTIKITWAALALATSYSVYQSKTSASTGYSLATSGVTATSWTTGTLSNGTYWFEVAGYLGTNWVSPNSTATPSRVISGGSCT